MNWLQPWHLIILVIALIVLFGAKRLPDAARSIGKSMKIFKAETRGLKDDSPHQAETAAPAATSSATSASSASVDAPRQITSDFEQARIDKLERELNTLKAQQQQRSPESRPGSAPHNSASHDSPK